jgi:hypothetical protein
MWCKVWKQARNATWKTRFSHLGYDNAVTGHCNLGHAGKCWLMIEALINKPLPLHSVRFWKSFKKFGGDSSSEMYRWGVWDFDEWTSWYEIRRPDDNTVRFVFSGLLFRFLVVLSCTLCAGSGRVCSFAWMIELKRHVKRPWHGKTIFLRMLRFRFEWWYHWWRGWVVIYVALIACDHAWILWLWHWLRMRVLRVQFVVCELLYLWSRGISWCDSHMLIQMALTKCFQNFFTIFCLNHFIG